MIHSEMAIFFCLFASILAYPMSRGIFTFRQLIICCLIFKLIPRTIIKSAPQSIYLYLRPCFSVGVGRLSSSCPKSHIAKCLTFPLEDVLSCCASLLLRLRGSCEDGWWFVRLLFLDGETDLDLFSFTLSTDEAFKFILLSVILF